jgi:hypothetical protein
MEVHTHGYCWNNADHNKRSDVSLCDSTPSSTPYVMVYNYGHLKNWIQMSNEGGLLNPCDHNIMASAIHHFD